MRRTATAPWVAGLLAFAFGWMLLLAVAPRLHEQIHADANRLEHSCGVSLISAGNCENPVSPDFAPIPAPVESTPATLVEVGHIPLLFLGASIFEHAPPSFS
jgi:hypothetical protein